MKKKLFLILFVASIALQSLAGGVEINGIHYVLDEDKMTASVTYTCSSYLYTGSSNTYSGDIIIPSSVSLIVDDGYKYYTVTSIGAYAFECCKDLTSVSIPNSVTCIERSSFGGCYGLTNLTIPNSVTSIEQYAFSGCSGLTNLTIPNSVTSIGMEVFNGCTGLTSITIPNTVKSIGKYAFSGCINLTNIVIGSSITNIAEGTFYYCPALTNVTIPESVTSVGEGAFMQSGLKSIILPNSVKELGEKAFMECANLESVTIGNSVIRIGGAAFRGCGNLKNISLGTSVKVIGSSAFLDCSNLQRIAFPNSLKSIEEGAFWNSGLTDLILNDGLETIGGNAFINCYNLKNVTIPESVTSIGGSAFYYCNITDVYAMRDNPTEYNSEDAFSNYNCTLHVPASSINAYKTTEPWSKFGTIMALSNEDNGIEINETNFPDVNFRNWLLEQEYGKDRLLTEEEIAKVMTIEVNEKGIYSLKGIEYFTELIAISCQNNQLTELDLSNNKALTWLNCSSNKLTALDLSKNTKLTYLRCYQNQIKGAAMDILVGSLPTILSYNTWNDGKMFAIYDENEQNEMTFAQVAVIKEKGWIPYACYDNEWEEYDGNDAPVIRGAINATNFPDKNFRNWLLSQEYGKDKLLTEQEIESVTEMELYYKNIQSLKGIEYFTALTSLGCDGNQLTELDLSKNNKLTILNCSDNQLTSLNVAGCTELIRILCYNNKLTELNVSGCTALTVLSCYQNQIKDEAMDALIESLPTVNEGSLPAIYNENEQNVITALQVEKAKAKGWKVYAYTGVDDWGKMYWEEYAGIDSDSDRIVVPTLAEKGVWYNLQGFKLSALQKGLNIIRMSDGTSRKELVR